MYHNELFTIFEILLNFGIILFLYRFFGKLALVTWISVSVILANIQVGILINLFGLESTLGNVAYASIFLATDILTENHSKQVARRAIAISFCMLIFFTLSMNLSFFFIPVDSFGPFKEVFNPMLRYLVASLIAYFISQNVDIVIYNFLKLKDSSFKFLWFRCNASSLVSEALDTAIFTIIAFLGTLSIKSMMAIFFSTYIIKVIATVCEVPLAYVAKYWHIKGVVK